MKTNNSLLLFCNHATKFYIILLCVSSLLSPFLSLHIFAQEQIKSRTDDFYLLDNYISSNYQNPIVFNAGNIKQFWINNSVTTQNDSINVLLKQVHNQSWESDNYRIQLSNVNPTMDCKICVITDDTKLFFSVLSSKNNPISVSSKEEDFIQYHVFSSTFHLEDVLDNSFNLKFHSDLHEILSIKRIVLSFSNNRNSSFRMTPGTLQITQHSVTPVRTALGTNEFTLTGKLSRIISKYNIILSNNDVKTSVTIKNIGNAPAQINVGFATYSQDGYLLDWKNYPYLYSLDKPVFNVVSSDPGSNTIIVDSLHNWRKNCYLAMNAKEDFSDIPNRDLLDGRVQDVRTLPDGNAEIVIDKPLKTAIRKGTKMRVQGLEGGYIYTSYLVLQPGEEKVLSSVIRKDDTFKQFSSTAFSKGVYYVTPILLSYSVGNGEAPTVLISNYTISY